MSRIEMRWSLPEDKNRIADLLEISDLPRWLAARENFLVAERDGEVQAALEYRMACGQLVLGILVSDLFVDHPSMAKALYTEAYAMAWVMGVEKIRALPTMNGEYPGEVGYSRWNSCWRLNVERVPRLTEETSVNYRHERLNWQCLYTFFSRASRVLGFSRLLRAGHWM
ncbi:hypothetical protein [Rubrobacter naiadicus]|uniref:hypothetical protein n=1 Tax=Rubrobacter naiadicus TaxID=1392641 RepID=UPI00236148EC|nr:hypothetical protein [Rubrobacter naiadicus]